MNLQQTVSAILNREVTSDEARNFALFQFGMLTTYIRERHKDSLLYQVNSATNVCAGRLENGAEVGDAFKWLDEEIEEIFEGKKLFGENS